MWWYDKLLDFQIDNAAIYDQALSDPGTQLVLAKLLDNRIVANRCDYRRLHTLLTQLAREARRYLSAKNGERLAIVDVSACQPLIVGLLASSPPNDPTRPRHTTTTLCQPPYAALRRLPITGRLYSLNSSLLQLSFQHLFHGRHKLNASRINFWADYLDSTFTRCVHKLHSRWFVSSLSELSKLKTFSNVFEVLVGSLFEFYGNLFFQWRKRL